MRGCTATLHVAVKAKNDDFGTLFGGKKKEVEEKQQTEKKLEKKVEDLVSSSYMQLNESNGRAWVFLIEKPEDRAPWKKALSNLGITPSTHEWPLL